MSEILNYLDSIAHLVPVFAAVIIILRILRRRAIEKKGHYSSLKREALMAIYLIVIFALFSQTVFSDIDTFMQDGWLNINLDPFRFVIHSQTAAESYFLINVLGNIIFFIPIGLITPLLFYGNDFVLSVGAGLLFSLSIELLQLPLLRATDIDDLILNTSGAFIGFVVYKIITILFPKIKNTFRIKK